MENGCWKLVERAHGSDRVATHLETSFDDKTPAVQAYWDRLAAMIRRKAKQYNK